MDTREEDVRNAIKSTLDSNGVLREVKAKMRAGVYSILNDKSMPTPEKPEEVSLASELIVDFLRIFNFDSSTNVFAEETGHDPKYSIGRSRLAEELGLSLLEDDGQIPVLVLLVQLLQSRKLDASMASWAQRTMEISKENQIYVFVLNVLNVDPEQVLWYTSFLYLL